MIKFWLFILAVPFMVWSFNRILLLVKDWIDYGISLLGPPKKTKGTTAFDMSTEDLLKKAVEEIRKRD